VLVFTGGKKGGCGETMPLARCGGDNCSGLLKLKRGRGLSGIFEGKRGGSIQHWERGESVSPVWVEKKK